MLMNFINREDFLSIDMDAIQDVDESEFDVSDIRNLRAIPMLFQTGYLTIANYDMATRTFNLTVPDEEVRQDRTERHGYGEDGRQLRRGSASAQDRP